MKRRRLWIILALLLMSIGFAAVSTTLYINGVLTIRTNNQDFDDNVIFTKATSDDESSALISSDGKTITFETRELSALGDEVTLSFRVKNNSRQYDAEGTINCDYANNDNLFNEYVSISISVNEFTLAAQESMDGILTVRLVKSFVGDEDKIGFECVINANALERTSLENKVIEPINVDAFNYIMDLKEAGDTSLLYDETGDNNLRYVGSNPNNYVLFNNELWRIIGLMNNIEDEYGNKGSYLKIIRNEAIGSYAYDIRKSGSGSVYTNDWSVASSMSFLNEGAYFNRTTGLCGINTYPDKTYTTECDFSEIGLTEEAKNLISKVVWHVGRLETSTSDTSIPSTAMDFYNAERGDDVYEGHSSEWLGYVGLMYVSDLGFSAYGETRVACLAKNLIKVSGCFSNSWLNHKSYIWTMTPSTYDSNMHIISTTTIIGYSGQTYPIIPTVYLYQNIKFMGGMGTSDDPYLLG